MAFLIWILVLNLVAFMSGWGLATSNSCYTQNWIMTIEICLAISLFSIVCAMVPAK